MGKLFVTFPFVFKYPLLSSKKKNNINKAK